MSDILDKAKKLLAARKFSALDNLLVKFPKHLKRQQLELTLAKLAALEADQSELEPVFDEYIQAFKVDVSANNLLLAANCKLHVKKWYEASELANSILELGDGKISSRQVSLAYEVILLAAYNLRQFDGSRKAVEQLKVLEPGFLKWLEWDIVIANAEDKPAEVLQSWNTLIQGGLPGELGHTQKVFSSVLRAYLSFDMLDRAETLIKEFQLVEMKEPSVQLALSAYFNFLGDLKKAEAVLDELLAIYPDLPEAQWNKSLYQLSGGELEEGWKNYEARWRWDNFSSPLRLFDSPRWTGRESLNGKKILVWSEQGVSDQLRFLSLLANLFSDYPQAQVTIEIDARLVPICRKWYPEANTRAHSMADTRGLEDFRCFDYNIPSGSLGGIYFNKVEKIRSSKFRSMRLPHKTRQKVIEPLLNLGFKRIIGFSWRSALMTNERSTHYFPVEKFISIFEGIPSDVGLMSLQYDIQGEEQRFLEQFPNVYVPNVNFLDDIPQHSVFAGSCDFIVTCRTIVATLGGLYGIPTISWMKVEDPGTLGQETYPWFPNRFNILTRPGFDKGDLHRRLSNITEKYSKSNDFRS